MKVHLDYLESTWYYQGYNEWSPTDFFNIYWDMDLDAPCQYMSISDNSLQLAIL